MLYFAYDGSIHGDWVARYAMRMASRLPDPGLQVLHVEDGKLSKADLKKRLARLEAASAELALPIEISVAPEPTSVAATLLRLVQVGSSRTTAPLARSCSSWPSAR